MPGEFRPEEILRVLEQHRVRHILIGGLAATLYGAAYITTDVDIAPDTGQRNLRRLADALRSLNARVRVEGEPEGVAFAADEVMLGRTEILNLVTDHGALDISFLPSGTRGYRDLARDAIEIQVFGVQVAVASLADVVRSKEAAGRPKDLLVLPSLRRLLEEGPTGR